MQNKQFLLTFESFEKGLIVLYVRDLPAIPCSSSSRKSIKREKLGRLHECTLLLQWCVFVAPSTTGSYYNLNGPTSLTMCAHLLVHSSSCSSELHQLALAIVTQGC